MLAFKRKGAEDSCVLATELAAAQFLEKLKGKFGLPDDLSGLGSAIGQAALSVLTSECDGLLTKECVKESLAKLFLQFNEFDCDKFLIRFLGAAPKKPKLEDL